MVVLEAKICAVIQGHIQSKKTQNPSIKATHYSGQNLVPQWCPVPLNFRNYGDRTSPSHHCPVEALPCLQTATNQAR